MNLRILFYTILIAFLGHSCKPEEPVIPPSPRPTPPVEEYVQYGTPLTQMPELSDVIMYEVNLRSFSESGDLQGVIARLDEIQAMGTNVIWLMPMYPIGEEKSVNSPYAIKDYEAVGEEFGDLADLRMLTDQAHARGMAVILDWVANHTAWDHPWISNPGWYTQDTEGNIIHPAGTNWQDVADLNFGNSQMRLAMIEAMQYWVYEANVDGYRCDAADFVPRDFWQQAIDSLRAIQGREFLMLAEGARMDHLDAGFDLNFSWTWYSGLKEVFGGQAASRLAQVHQQQYTQIGGDKHELRFVTNHDESAWDATPVQLFGGQEGSLAAMAVTTFMGGVPLIYGGQEVAPEATIPFFSNQPIDWTANPDYYAEFQSIMQVYSASSPAKQGSLVNVSESGVSAFLKVHQGDSLLVMANLRNSGGGITLPEGIGDSDWIDAQSGEVVSLSTAHTLGPYAYALLKK